MLLSRYFLIFLICCNGFSLIAQEKLKVLHLSFHSGCINDFEGVAQELDLDVTSWQITRNVAEFDPETKGNAIYNMGHDRAARIFNRHREYFESFDVILTSDTAPLSRIFLQNGWTKPLIIWICNRFDYHDGASLDCDFPDREYYDLFKAATYMPNVRIAAYNDFERFYCQTKGIDIGPLNLKPSIAKIPECTASSIPGVIDKSQTFFLPPYHNETKFMNLVKKCKELKIQAYNGRYNGPDDLKGFKGIIHLPYAWSNLALFENMYLGIPYFIPTPQFVQKIAKKGNYFIPNAHYFFNLKLYSLTEWYGDEFKDIFTYFDSWDDLKIKIKNTNFPELSEKIKLRATKHRENTINQWRDVFDSLL